MRAYLDPPPPVRTSLGVELDASPSAFGELADASPALAAGDFVELRRRYAEDGYLLLRGLLARRDVDAARAEIVDSLAERGLLDPRYPREQRIARRGVAVSPFGVEDEERRFPAVRAMALGGALAAFHDRLLEAAARAFDFVWLRIMAPGQATPPHCDIVYMGRGSHELCTSWIPLSPVGPDDGPLMLLERSHAIARLREGYSRMDADRDGHRRRIRVKHGRIFRGGDYSRHPRRARAELGGRWLTSTFEPGDVVVFSPFLLHGSLDNASRAFRLSVDVRYQRASDPFDERWIGEHPIAHSRAE